MAYPKGRKNPAATAAQHERWADLDANRSRGKKHGQLLVARLSKEEFAEIHEKALRLNMSRTEMVVRAVRAYEPLIEED